ncbi:helix-turn-helix domain-containing protein, partial [Lentzea roselyniae]|uniref:helix-turn-helix domain-containing protein n=1 Tax=Lentzea roselyniae TaxID=531940 RepID=UPI0031F859F2
MSVKRQYFELIKQGMKGAAAARVVGVSASCGSLWFLDAGGVLVDDPGPISPRFLTQDERIAVADGLQAKQSIKDIAASIGKSFQTVYRLPGDRPQQQIRRPLPTMVGSQPGAAAQKTPEGPED